jgi:hypothetical protein
MTAQQPKQAKPHTTPPKLHHPDVAQRRSDCESAAALLALSPSSPALDPTIRDLIAREQEQQEAIRTDDGYQPAGTRATAAAAERGEQRAWCDQVVDPWLRRELHRSGLFLGPACRGLLVDHALATRTRRADDQDATGRTWSAELPIEGVAFEAKHDFLIRLYARKLERTGGLAPLLRDISTGPFHLNEITNLRVLLRLGKTFDPLLRNTPLALIRDAYRLFVVSRIAADTAQPTLVAVAAIRLAPAGYPGFELARMFYGPVRDFVGEIRRAVVDFIQSAERLHQPGLPLPLPYTGPQARSLVEPLRREFARRLHTTSAFELIGEVRSDAEIEALAEAIEDQLAPIAISLG